MVNTTKVSDTKNQCSTLSEQQGKKHLKLTEITYRNNTESDYTEKIEQLEKSFNYSSNSNYYWSKPELSTLYGTPLYEEASPAQKIALNHLYWVRQYSQTAATEGNTILYNQITKGVFAMTGGYDTLCRELELETNQERSHIHAFHIISYKTNRSLLGKAALNAPFEKKSGSSVQNGSTEKAAPRSLPKPKFPTSNLLSSASGVLEDSIFRLLRNIRLHSQAHCYSPYLKEMEAKDLFLPAPRSGMMRMIPRSLLRLMTLNWGTSPFLACQFYATRYIANMLLKNYEYDYTRYFKELEKKGESVPTPTAVSHYHLLDESFHTTTSQLIAQDLYKDFPKPTAYESFMANLTIYMMQKSLFSSLSGGIPAVFQNDEFFMLSYYRLLQSPVFNMSAQEALYWMEKCLCHEHEGFHVNFMYHQRFLSDLCRFSSKLDYMWPVNREMRFMASGGSIAKAIQNNIEAFKRFSKSVAQSH